MLIFCTKAIVSEENTFLGMLAGAMAPMMLHPLFRSLRKTAYRSLKHDEISENEPMGHPVDSALDLSALQFI